MKMKSWSPGTSMTFACWGMVPGFVAGRYSREDVEIDAAALPVRACARIVTSPLTGVDAQERRLHLAGRPSLPRFPEARVGGEMLVVGVVLDVLLASHRKDRGVGVQGHPVPEGHADPDGQLLCGSGPPASWGSMGRCVLWSRRWSPAQAAVDLLSIEALPVEVAQGEVDVRELGEHRVLVHE